MGFSHSNFPSGLQFGYITFFSSSITKMSHWGCISGKKNKLSKLVFNKQESSCLTALVPWEQTVFLKGSRRAQPKSNSSRLRSNKHFSNQRAAWRGSGRHREDVPPQRSTARKLKEQFIPFLLSSCQSRSTPPVFSFGPFSTSKAQSGVSLAEGHQIVRGLEAMPLRKGSTNWGV